MSGPTQGDHTPDEFDDLVRDVAQETETADVQHPTSFRHPTIDGYEFLRELHRGGQGIVYEALQRSTKRKVAIKVLVAGRYASRAARRRFEREIELVAQLRHTNIISIFHSGETSDGMQYLVMDYVRGRPIDRYVREKALSLLATMRLFAAVCDGVQFAHQRGVIHRDLKPSNVLVDVDGSPRVLDFGLAKLLVNPAESLVSLSEQVIGTLNYMSPEQARGNPDEVDTRTDVYSLGVMLYRLLTGQFPYPVTGPISEAMRHIAETEPTALTRKWTPQLGVSVGSVRKRGADDCPIDTDVQTIALTALAKERERRYQTAGELARDVRHWLAGEPLDARRDNTWYVFRKSVKRYKAPVAAGCAFVALLCAAVVAVSVYWYRAEEAREVAEQQTTLAVELGQLAQHRLAQTRRHAYASDMLLAKQAWENADIKRVRDYLDAHKPEPGMADLRGFEWYYYRRLCHTEIATGVMNDFVWALDFSPDGSTLAAGSFRTALLRDLATGRETKLNGHEHHVLCLAFSPDGTLIASGSQDGTIRLWDVASGTELASARVGIIFSVDFAPDGKTLAAVGAQTDMTAVAGLWSVPTLQSIGPLPGHDGMVENVTYAPDGKRLFTAAADGTIRVWSTGERRVLDQYTSYDDSFVSLALSPDGTTLAVAGYDAGTKCQIKLFRSETGEKIATLAESEAETKSLAFSPDGKWLLSGGFDRKAKLWDVASLELINTIRGHESNIYNVAFSPIGGMLATAGQDNTYKLWNVDLRQGALRIGGHDQEVKCVTASPTGGWLASGGHDGALRLWRGGVTTDPVILEGHRYDISAAAFSPDGTTLITTSGYQGIEWSDGHPRPDWQKTTGELKWWDVERAAESRSLEIQGDYVKAVSISADGLTLATLRRKPENARAIDLWDARTAQKTTSLTAESLGSAAFWSLAYSPDGAWLAAGRTDGVVSLWQMPEAREYPLEGHSGMIRAVAFGPRGQRLAVIGTEGTLAVWITETRELAFKRQEAPLLMATCFSPDGRVLAAAGRDSLISLRDVHTGQLRASFDVGPRASGYYEVSSLTFTPDGRRLVAAVGSELLVWEAAASDTTP